MGRHGHLFSWTKMHTHGCTVMLDKDYWSLRSLFTKDHARALDGFVAISARLT